MAVLGGIVGAIVGFAIGVVFTEVIFANNHEWPIIVPFGLAVLGWLVGSTSVRRFADRSKPPRY
jgi:hypothetical protein